jgi:hypothetical protein
VTQADLDSAQALSEAIAHYAPALHVGPSINPIALLRAIAAQETSDPVRILACKHENAYCYGGKYHREAAKAAEWRYGCACHCSWGPWQIMYETAVERGFADDPVQLRDPMISGAYVVAQLNARVFDWLSNPSLQDVFDAWNSGTARDNIFPAKYVSEATALYQHFIGGKDLVA